MQRMVTRTGTCHLTPAPHRPAQRAPAPARARAARRPAGGAPARGPPVRPRVTAVSRCAGAWGVKGAGRARMHAPIRAMATATAPDVLHASGSAHCPCLRPAAGHARRASAATRQRMDVRAAHGHAQRRRTAAGAGARLRVADGLRAHDARGAAEQRVPARRLAHHLLLPRPRPPQRSSTPRPRQPRSPPLGRGGLAQRPVSGEAPRPQAAPPSPCAPRFTDPALPCPIPALPAAAACRPRIKLVGLT